MRFKDFLITLLTSTIVSLIIIWTLINAGIIPTHQQHPQLYIKQQHHSGTLFSVFNETSKIYEANIVRLPIENVSDKSTLRLLHISLEANVTNYDPYRKVTIDSFQLKDQLTETTIAEKDWDFKPISYKFLAIDISVSPLHSYYVSMAISGTYGFTLKYDLTIVQELIT